MILVRHNPTEPAAVCRYSRKGVMPAARSAPVSGGEAMQVTDRVDSVRVAPNTRLTFLGRLAQRIGEHPDAHDLSMFVYAQLRDTLPVDSFYAARAGLQSEGLYGVLAEDEGVESPPSSVYIAPYDE